MHRERPLLTIAIPTYNRSKYLVELLESLKPQIAGEHRVELIVSDNASEDDTLMRLEEFRQQGLNLELIVNESNLGADANILQCFNVARGKYVWVFGSDDILLRGALAKILGYLEGCDYDLVHVAAYGFMGDYQEKQARAPYGNQAYLVENPNYLVETINAMFSLITGNITNKDRFMRLQHPPPSELIGTGLIQLGWTFTILKHLRKALYIREPLIAARTANSSGWSLPTVFGANLKAVCDKVWAERPDLYRSFTSGILRTWYTSVTMSARRGQMGDIETDNMHRLLRPIYGKDILYWLYLYPVLRTPLPMAKLWFLAVRAMNITTAAIKFYLLPKQVADCN